MQSGWDDDGDDDDVDGGADFLLFCLFHVSSADEFLLQTGVVRQSVKYLYWHTYGYDYIWNRWSFYSLNCWFVSCVILLFIIISELNI